MQNRQQNLKRKIKNVDEIDLKQRNLNQGLEFQKQNQLICYLK